MRARSPSNPIALTAEQWAIVCVNQGLVYAMLDRFPPPRGDEEDALDEGMNALCRAARKFDPNRGYRFSTYACRAILCSFGDARTRGILRRRRFKSAGNTSRINCDPLILADRPSSQIEPPDQVCHVEQIELVQQCLNRLDTLTQSVLRGRFGFDGERMTLRGMAALLGYSVPKIHTVELKGIERLRRLMQPARQPDDEP